MNEKKILVVDDEAAIRDIVKQALEHGEFTVITVESAEKAIDILRQDSIMVMFLDLKLPGMTGLELCELIRKQNPLAIIYALTGYTDLFGLLDCRKAGFDDFFAKPVSIELLLEAAKDAFMKLERWKVEEFDLV